MDETQPLLPSQSHNGHIIHPHPVDPTASAALAFGPKGDPDDPQQWRTLYKWGITTLLAFMSFTVTFTCISLVPIANHIVADLDGQSGQRSTSTAGVLLVTIWELGEAAGPLLIAPLSEVYGRSPVFNVANALFIVSTALGAMSQSTGLLILARFVTGTAVASNVLNPAIIGDIFPTEQRGSAMSLIMLTPLVGGAVGPAIAGAIAQTTGWRQVMWMSLGLATFAELMFLLFFRETYKPAVLRRRAYELGLVSGKGTKTNDVESDFPDKAETKSPVWESIKRPITIFFSSLILQILSLYGAVVFSFFYVVSTTLPGILEHRYNFPPALVGSSFLSFSIGSLFAVAATNFLLDRIYNRLQDPNQPPQPENRLPLVIFGAFALPLTVCLYGWSAELKLPVWVLLLSVVLLGFCVILGLVPVMSYVVDAFGLYSASALTAVLITRCLAGTFLPLAAAPLEARMGYGWGMMVLAGLSLSLAPVPVLVFKYGGKWRECSVYTKSA